MSAYADDTTMNTIFRSTATTAASIEDMSASLDRLQRWGEQWRVRVEPTKFQLLHISNHPPLWAYPQVSFGGHAITAATEVKFRGVTFDNKLNFASHIRAVALRATTYLHQLNRVQCRVPHPLGPGVILQSLAASRDVYALAFLYKLMYRDKPLQLLAILTRRQDPNLDPRTRSQRHQSHDFHLCQVLAPNVPNFLKRSFPHGIMSTWNSLTPKLFPTVPASKSIQPFKMNVHRHLRRSNWLSATHSL